MAYRVIVIVASAGAFLVVFASLVRASGVAGGMLRFLFLSGLPLLGAVELVFAILCPAYLERAKSHGDATRRLFRLLAYVAAAALVGQLIHVGLVIALTGWSVRGSFSALTPGDLGPLALYAILVIVFGRLSVPRDPHDSPLNPEE